MFIIFNLRRFPPGLPQYEIDLAFYSNGFAAHLAIPKQIPLNRLSGGLEPEMIIRVSSTKYRKITRSNR